MGQKGYLIEYMDGKKEEIASNKIIQYRGDSHITGFQGTGCDSDFLQQLLKEKRSIVIAKEFGKPKIERIINTQNVRAINVLETKLT